MNPAYMAAIGTTLEKLKRKCTQCGKENKVPYEKREKPILCGACHKELPPPGSPKEGTTRG